MSSKKAQNYVKDSFRQEGINKRIDEQVNQRVRVIQNNLVFINGLPSDLSSKEQLETDLYFGRYGKVVKIIVNPSQPFKKNVTYQAYVTYESKIDASLAIVALDGFKLSQRPLKVSYGTTKYCSHFLRGYECPNSDCYYLHKIDKKKQIINGDTRSVFKEQNNTAIDIVCDNLEEVISRSISNQKQKIIEGFPTLTQMLQFLIESKAITQSQVDSIKKKLNVKKSKVQSQIYQNIPKQIPKTLSVDSPKQSKLTKSSSFSTTCSPLKTQSSETKAQIIESKIVQNKHSIDEEIVKQIDFKIEQKIEKLILKQLLKNQKQCKSRFQFVDKQIKCKIQQIDRIKGIFQKFLIVHN